MIESCFQTEFVFSIILQVLAEPGDAIHSLSLPLIGSRIGPRIVLWNFFHMITKLKSVRYPLLKTYLSPLLRDSQWVLCFRRNELRY